MTNYICQVAKQITDVSANHDYNFDSLLVTLAEALDRLDVYDFLPNAQRDFVLVRQKFRVWAAHGKPGVVLKEDGRLDENPFSPSSEKAYHDIVEAGKQVVKVLNQYAGEGSHATTRSFAFIKDEGLRRIIERDYKELSLILFPGGAWKSTVIMAGSVFEAILYDLLTDPARLAKAKASAKAPSDKKSDLEGGKWKLESLIDVAVDLDLLPKGQANAIHQVLRNYRNFVHPKKEVKAEYPCSEAESLMAKGELDSVCNHFAKTLT